jgi:subtilisin family serine protease
MKKLASLLLTISLCLTALPAAQFNAQAQTTGGKFLRTDRPLHGQYIVVLTDTDLSPIPDEETPPPPSDSVTTTRDETTNGSPATGAVAAEPEPATEPAPDPTPSETGDPEPTPTPDEIVLSTARELTGRYGGTVGETYGAALKGFALRASEDEAIALSTDDRVAFVQEDGEVSLEATQWNPPSWGLDRIDQRFLPLSSSYTYNRTGAGVNAYVIDTGIYFQHVDFGNRAFIGFDSVNDGWNGRDCNGHGTHVAATLGGTRYGVAKGTRIFGVRVLNCGGFGTWGGVIAGVNWVTWHRQQGPFRNSPAVANMSLGGGANAAVDAAVRNSIRARITYSIAAGNSNANALFFSPARVGEAITVGATDRWDFRAWFSNWGTGLDLFAPGVDITSAWIGFPTASNTISGTSMAAPHAGGVAALYLQAVPWATPAQVSAALNANATAGVVINPGTGSPNRLLFTNY